MVDYREIKVLLVEDDADDYRLLERQLRRQHRGFVIDWASSLGEARQKLEKLCFDVVVTDLSLPDSAGLSTVSELRRHSLLLPIIVLTSLEDEVIEQDILEAGAQDYLVKGELGGSALMRAIGHAFQRQESQNEVRQLLEELERSQLKLRQQARLLKKKNKRLERSYRLAQEFVDNVSHDFRTPLTVIKDFVTIVREGMMGEINDEQRSALDRVAVRADDLNTMVDDLLDVSKLESGLLGAWRRNVSIHDVICRAESMLEQRAQVANVQLTVASSPDLPRVYCDSDHIGRVITNLAINAIKFCGRQGNVQLWAREDPANNQVIVGVTDNGPGIDEDSLQKIFERWSQLDSRMRPTVKGFGIGLSIAHQLCKVNLGEFSVESKVGEGSTFSFSVPYADPSEVLKRWLNARSRKATWKQLLQISIPKSTKDPVTHEFDSFLNCLLRKPDLLFRTGPYRWLLVMEVASSESRRWKQRAAEEFQRTNRNRPAGPLPDYVVRTLARWPENSSDEAILRRFGEILEPESVQTVNA